MLDTDANNYDARSLLEKVRQAISIGNMEEARRFAFFLHQNFENSPEKFAAQGSIFFAIPDVRKARIVYEGGQEIFETDEQSCKEYAFILYYLEEKEEAFNFASKTFKRFPGKWMSFDTYRHFLRATGRSDLSANEVFKHIYDYKMWGNGSGSGSSPDVAAPYAQFLTSFIRNNTVTSIVDVGCGDWQFTKLMEFSSIDYLGIDIVPSVIEDLRDYERDGIEFRVADFARESIRDADLLIIKEVLQHCSIETLQNFISRFAKYKFVLVTNEFPTNALKYLNIDIPDGSCRPVDLSKPPFGLAGAFIFEYGPENNFKTYLYTSSKGSPSAAD